MNGFPLFSLLFGLTLAGVAAAQAAPSAPAVERIEPAAGPPGTVVSVIGRRFGTGAQVWIGDRPVEVLEALPSRLKVKVPKGVKSGPLTVAAGKQAARGPDFRVTPLPPSPAITSVKPASGPAGSEVVIAGRNFSPRLTGNQVTLAGKPALVRSASPVALTVIVPEGVDKGRFAVRVPPAGEVASAEEFRVTAETRIADVRPRRAGPGAKLSILGTGFSKNKANNRVYLSNRPLTVLAASPTRLEVQLSQTPASGPILVDVKGAGRAESPRPFEVQAPPKVLGLSPQSAPPGSYVALRGVHFGNDPEAVEAKLGDRPMRVIEVRPEELVVEVPGLPRGTSRRAKRAHAALSAKVSVRVNGVGPGESRATLTVLAPLRLARFSPRQGPAGAMINLAGSGFADTPSENLVTIGGAPAQVLSATPARLRVRVPDGKSGPIKVSVAGQTVKSTAPFVVTQPPRVTGLTPTKAEPGARVTVHGQGFGSKPALVRASVGGVRARVLTVKDDLLVLVVPRAAATGPVEVSVRLQGRAKSAEPLTIVEALRVTDLSPARVPVGGTLTVRGGGFVPGQTTVAFGDQQVTPEKIEKGELQVVVPDAAGSCQVRVILADGRRVTARNALQIGAKKVPAPAPEQAPAKAPPAAARAK